MTKQKFKGLISLLVSLAMVCSLSVAPAFAEEAESGGAAAVETVEPTSDGETGEEAAEEEAEAETEAESEITADDVQAMIDALPDADDITADNVDDVESQLDAIDEARVQIGEDADYLDYTKYDEACAALEALYSAQNASTADVDEKIDELMPEVELPEGAERSKKVAASGSAVSVDDTSNVSYNSNTYSTVSAAIDAIETNGTITLTGNVSEASITIPSGKNITLDLGGYTLTLTGGTTYTDTGYTGSTFRASLVNGGTLTVQNGSLVGNGMYTTDGSTYSYVSNMILNVGTLNIASDADVIGELYVITNVGGSVTTSGDITAEYYDTIATYGGSITVNDGTITAMNTTYWGCGINEYGRYYNTTRGTEAAATVTINGGTINAYCYGVSTNNQLSGDSSLTINGGTINAGVTCIYWPTPGTITIGTQDSTSDETPYLTSSGSGIIICCGTLNVYSGTIAATDAVTDSTPYDTTEWASGYRANSGAAGLGDAVTVIANRSAAYAQYPLTVNLAGGTYISASNYAVRYANCNAASDTDSTDTEQTISVELSGGTYTGGETTDGTAVAAIGTCEYEDTANISTLTVTGGTYSSNVSSYTSSTATAVATTDEDGNTVYKIVETVAGAVAMVYDKDGEYVASYTSLSEAFSNVADGGAITLVDNVTDESTDVSDNGLWQVSGKAVTLDLNNHALTSSAKRMFGVLNAGSLTVKNGSVTSTYSSSDVTMIITRGGSTFEAEGVTFNAGSTHDYLAYTAGSDTVSLTNCTINNVKNAVVKDNSSSATITLSGCTYTKTPIVGKNVGSYKIIINGNGGSITSASDAPEIDSNGIVRLDFNYIVEDGGSIVTDSNTIYLRNDSGASSLTVNGGTVTANAVEVRDTTTLAANGGVMSVNGAITVKDGGTLVIDGGTVSADSIAVNKDASMTVNGGATTVTGNITMSGATSSSTDTENLLMAVSEDEDTIPDCALTINGGTISVGQIYSQDSIAMTGGTVTSSSSKDNGVIYAKSGSIYITGGSVVVSGTRGVVIDDGVTGIISGGTFSATSIGLLTRGTGMTIKGGTYIATTGLYTKDTSVLAEGCSVYNTVGNTVSANSNGEYKSTETDLTVFVSSGVAEVNGTKYGTIARAIAAAGDGETVTLLASTSEDVVIPEGAEVTLDLAGYTLTNVADHTITVEYGATLTVTDSSEGKTGTVDNVTHGKAAIYNSGTVTLDGGKYTRSQENGQSSTDNGGNSFYVLLNHGTMTINSGVTVTQDGHYSSMIDNGYYSYNSGNPDSGYVEGTNAEYPSLTINGGTFSGGLNTVKNDDCASLTINGGEFSNVSQDIIQNHSTLTITGGTFTASGNADVIWNCGCDSTLDKGVLTITGGTFIAGADYPYVLIDVSTADTAAITISGGSFTGEIWTSSTSVAEWAITGGTYTVDVSDYCASGYTANYDEDTKTYGIETIKVAKIGETEYTSLAAAVEAATSGQTVTLLTDTKLDSSIILSGKSITLDLNGHAVERGASTTSYLIGVAEGASLTVTDSSDDKDGYIDGATYTTSEGTFVGYGISTNGTLILESGTLKGYYGVSVSGTSASFTMNGGTVSGTLRGISGSTGTITVSGGSVECSSSSTSTLAIFMNNGTVNMSGGSVSCAGTAIKIQGGEVNVSGGTLSAATGVIALAYNSDATANVTGGTINCTSVGVYAYEYSYEASINVSGETTSITGIYGAEVFSGAALTISGGTVTGTTCGVFMGEGTSDDYTTLYITGGSINAEEIGVCNNGSQNYTKIVMTGGSITAPYGMYIPAMNSTTEISGGTITASVTGIEIRAGELTVSGGTIKSTCETFSYTFNGSGTTVCGAGIAISQHSTNQPVKVTITGGDISGIYGIFEVNTYSTSSSDVTLTISDGEDESSPTITGSTEAVHSVSLSGDVAGLVEGVTTYASDATTFAISGGTYSTAVDPEYCADGYTPSENVDGTYGVTLFYLGVSNNSETQVPATIMSEENGVMYVRVSATNIGSYSNNAYPTTTLKFTDDDDEEHSYIFGGWYTVDEDGAYTELSAVPEDSVAYAKFVDASILTVQCYVTDASGYRWRFVTSVDNAKYLSAGFEVTSNNEAVTMENVKYYKTKYTITSATNKVAASTDGMTAGTVTPCSAGTAIITPSDFATGATYIVTAAVSGATTNTTYTVRPYWVTVDGTTVYGESTTFIYNYNNSSNE